MKVLHVIPDLQRGGAERMVLDIMAELSKRSGIEAHLLVLGNQNHYQEQTVGLPITYIPDYVRPSLWRKHQIRISTFKAFLLQWKPDIIHTHLFQADFLVRMVAGHAYPIVTHFHDNMPQYRPFSVATFRSKKALTNFYERRLIQSTWNHPGNRFIAISRHTEAYLNKVIPKQGKKIKLLFNAIDLERFYPPKQRNRDPDQIQLINIGSFIPKKNQRFLIDVMERLPKQYHLIFLGNGPDRKALESVVKQKGLSNRIQVKGIVSHPEDYLRDSTIYVHTAFYEPFGLVIIEAMATGLPVVTLDGGGNRDIVENGVNGYILEELDPNHFAQQIRLLVDNPDTCQQLSNGALQTAQRFGMGAYVAQLIQIYQEAIAEAAALQIA